MHLRDGAESQLCRHVWSASLGMMLPTMLSASELVAAAAPDQKDSGLKFFAHLRIFALLLLHVNSSQKYRVCGTGCLSQNLRPKSSTALCAPMVCQRSTSSWHQISNQLARDSSIPATYPPPECAKRYHILIITNVHSLCNTSRADKLQGWSD
eukprot:2129211-Pleurochrysis_carterae.AAC.3